VTPPTPGELAKETTRRAKTRHVVSIEHEVPFHDVDLTHRVWHGHYYKYFELARTALFRRYGLDDGNLIPKQFSLYVIETRCRYTSPLHYGDAMRVSAWFKETKRRLAVSYEIKNLKHQSRAARGLTTLAIVGLDGQLLVETPPQIIERIQAADAE
jgi:acyl-CoA thioester hydrolase